MPTHISDITNLVFLLSAGLASAVLVQYARLWRGQLDVFLLWLGLATNAAWAIFLFVVSASNIHHLNDLFFESPRIVAWWLFLFHVYATQTSRYDLALSRLRLPLALAICGVLLVVLSVPFTGNEATNSVTTFVFRLEKLGLILGSVGSICVVHTFHKELPADRREKFRALLIAIALMLSAETLGAFINFIAGPIPAAELIRSVGISAAAVVLLINSRVSSWSQSIHLSHNAALTSAFVAVSAVFLGVFALASWLTSHAAVHPLGLLALPLVAGLGALTVYLLLADDMRAKLKVSLNKHFFNYKYDYREEWLRFIRTLSRGGPGAHLLETVVEALAQIVGSHAGLLWLRADHGPYNLSAHVATAAPTQIREPQNGGLVQFLLRWQWVINLDEYREDRELYAELELPPWLREYEQAWLIVPLMQDVELLGFVVIERPSTPHAINWEDHDLLKTAGRQAATHLAQLMTVQALVEAREFQTFSRLSAFVIHDLKNLVAQLSLVVTNAAKHKHNPAFMEDAIGTVQNSVAKMNRLLTQLRKSKMQPSKPAALNVANVLREVVKERSDQHPQPTIEILDETIILNADHDRVNAVFTHLIQNAQEATTTDGWVKVKLSRSGNEINVEIADNGCGMDANFIRDRLFRPFDSTKGHGGMGIGAYESRDYVRELKGDLIVTSSPGKGSVFLISLPIH